MRIILIVLLYNILPIIRAQHKDLINEDLGDLHFEAKVGHLPSKYRRLTEQDQKASDKAADVVDFIQLMPKVDPLILDVSPPLGIDLAFLWLTGKVYMKNFILSGIKQFNLHSVELRIDSLRSDLDISLPLVHFEGDFYLQATLAYVPLVLKCHVSVNLMDMDIMVSAGARKTQNPSVGSVLLLESADIKVDIRNVRFNITRMTFDIEEEDVGPVLMQLFSKSSDPNAKFFDGLLKTAIQIANKELINVSSDALKEYLLTDVY